MTTAEKTKELSEDLLRELITAVRDSQIIHLGLAGVPQHTIREIVGVNMNRVTKVVKHLKKTK